MADAGLVSEAIEHPSAAASVQHRSRLQSCAAAAVGSVAVILHLWAAVAQSRDLLMSVIMLAMSLVCVPCVLAVWRRCTAHSVTMLMAMSLGCALMNLCILVGFPSAMGMDHSGAAPQIDADVAGPTAHAPLMLLVIALEIVTAGIAAVCVRRFSVHTTTQPRE